MKLFIFPVAPNPTRVRLYLAEKCEGGATLDVEDLLDRVNEQLADGRPMLMGDAASIADRTLAAALQFGRMGQVEIPASHEHIARWDRTFRQRASARQVLIM
ncbi:MAG: hypothetical protein H8E78_08300 [Proteobacteria bacterium]|nr:hypothetical protein [Pseudomonadota bacterium]